MMRRAYSLLTFSALALGPLLTLAAPSQAQTTPTTTGAAPMQAIQQGLVVKKDGVQLKNEPVVYIKKSDCDENAVFQFSVTYTSPPRVVEAWVGVGTQDCAAEASRQRATNGTGTTSVCKLVGRNSDSNLKPSITVDANTLFSKNAGSRDFTDDDAGAGSDAGDGLDGSFEIDSGVATDAGADAGTDAGGDEGLGPRDCDEVTNQTYTVFILPLDQPTDVLANTAYPPLKTTGYSTLTATFTLFTKLPNAPSGLKPQDGETQLEVTFDTISGAIAKTKYKAYFDWGEGADGATCGSGTLASGGEPPRESATLAGVTTTSGSAVLSNLDAKGIEINQRVSTSVVTVDPAGNESLLSEPVCVTRVLTDGFYDKCKADPKCIAGLESCSLRPASSLADERALGLLALFGTTLGLFWIRRRRV